MADQSPGSKNVSFVDTNPHSEDCEEEPHFLSSDEEDDAFAVPQDLVRKLTVTGFDDDDEDEDEDEEEDELSETEPEVPKPSNPTNVASPDPSTTTDTTQSSVSENPKIVVVDSASAVLLSPDASEHMQTARESDQEETIPALDFDLPMSEFRGNPGTRDRERKKITFKIGEESGGDIEEKLLGGGSAVNRRKSMFSSKVQAVDVHDMLVELYDLTTDEEGHISWQETARWIKYEEDAEGLDRHWGKPHVAFLSFHALIQVRKCLTKGLILLDAEGENFEDLCNLITAAMKSQYDMDEGRTAAILQTLNRQHRHVHEATQSILPRKMTTAFHLNNLDRSQLHRQRGISMDTNGKKASTTIDLEATHRNGNDLDSTAGKVLNQTFTDPSNLSLRSVSVHNTSRSMAVTQKPGDISKLNSEIFARKSSKFFPSVLSSSRTESATGMDEYDQNELLKRVPDNAETAQVFVGILKELKKVRFAMVRLRNASCIPELLEAPIPIRFIFVILGPDLPDVDYHELGRSISTLMSNHEFHADAYHANGRMELVKAVDTFLDGSIVIPPGEIDHKRLFTVEDIKKALRKRSKKQQRKMTDKQPIIKEEDEFKEDDKGGRGTPDGKRRSSVASSGTTSTTSTVTRTGRIFGGAILDVKNRIPHYWSDFTDALNFQCLSTVVFMFFASFAPAITFGGLMGDYTHGTMGMMETLLAQCLGGLVWGFFSAQPLMIMSPTGPVLIFEASLYTFCEKLGLDFLVIRVWSGLWVFAISLVVVACEGVFLVSYVTQFTEDIFSCLISIIFIAESVKFLKKNFYHHPVLNLQAYQDEYEKCLNMSYHFEKDDGSFSSSLGHGHGSVTTPGTQISSLSNLVTNNSTSLSIETTMKSIVSTIFSFEEGYSYSMKDTDSHCPKLKKTFDSMQSQGILNASYIQDEVTKCCQGEHQPDTGLLTAILLLTTFVLALLLKRLKTSQYLGKTLRRALSDFGVLIAILLVTLIDYFVFSQPFLKRLSMPHKPEFTDIDKRIHGLFIPFALPADQWWGYLFAALPAFLVFILLFVETEITGLLLAKKDRALRKGSGFHWDLLLVGLMTFVCSIFGLPWMCAAAVQSLAHASSLSVMNRHAPGETPSVSHVIEQRVTTIGVSILIGACTYAGSFLSYMPLAVLFGVFLYLGVMNLAGVQLLQRITLCFLPRKHFPDHPYCQEVSFWRMHLFTFIQIVCLVVIYMVKYFKSSSLGFPFILMMIALMRFFILPKIFKEKELAALDGHDTEYNEEEDMYEGAPIPV